MTLNQILHLLGHTGEDIINADIIDGTKTSWPLVLVYKRLSFRDTFLLVYEVRTSGVATDFLLTSIARCPFPVIAN